MFTFKFKVNDDQSVDIRGMQTGSTKEIAGAGQTWRAWHNGGRGYQQWKYGASSIWIVNTDGDTLMRYFDFEFGHKWQSGRKIITQIVEELNKNPMSNHTPYLYTQRETGNQNVKNWNQ